MGRERRGPREIAGLKGGIEQRRLGLSDVHAGAPLRVAETSTNAVGEAAVQKSPSASRHVAGLAAAQHNNKSAATRPCSEGGAIRRDA